MSEPQTLARAILIRAAPGSGSGTGYSRISNGLPVPWNTAIRAVSAITDLLWWPVSYRNAPMRLAGVEVVDLLDERADLEHLIPVVRDIELTACRFEALRRDEALLEEHHRERVHLGGELLDDIAVAAAEARDDLGDELLLFGREAARCAVSHGLARLRTTCHRARTERPGMLR